MLKSNMSCEPGTWIVLPIQITILGVATIAEVWPKPMESPLVWWEQLAVRFEASVCVPVLG